MGPPKPTFLEVFMVNNLVFRWPKPLFFMVLGAQGTLREPQHTPSHRNRNLKPWREPVRSGLNGKAWEVEERNVAGDFPFP